MKFSQRIMIPTIGLLVLLAGILIIHHQQRSDPPKTALPTPTIKAIVPATITDTPVPANTPATRPAPTRTRTQEQEPVNKEAKGPYKTKWGILTLPRQVYVPIDLSGFQPGETVRVVWSTVEGTFIKARKIPADSQGNVRMMDFTGCNGCPQKLLPDGVTVVRGTGQTSQHKDTWHISVDYAASFFPIDGLSASVEPRTGFKATGNQVGTYFRINGTGFKAMSTVKLTIIAPDGKQHVQQDEHADQAGRVMDIWTLNDTAQTGTWTVKLQEGKLQSSASWSVK